MESTSPKSDEPLQRLRATHHGLAKAADAPSSPSELSRPGLASEEEFQLRLPNAQLLRMYHQLAIPAPGERARFSGVEYQRPLFGEYEQACAEWGLARTLAALGAAGGDGRLFATALACVLLERQTAFVSSDLGLLSAVTLCLPTLIRPFEYACTVIPVLPSCLFSYLEAPVPLIVGVTCLPEGWERMAAQDVTFIDLDRRAVHAPPRALPLPPHLPALQAALRTAAAALLSVREGQEHYAGSRTSANVAALIALMCEDYFLDLFSPLLLRQNSIRNVTEGHQPVSVFIKESFLLAAEKASVPFWTEFFETQTFSQFVDATLREIDATERVSTPIES